jgi:hypothetical protein
LRLRNTGRNVLIVETDETGMELRDLLEDSAFPSRKRSGRTAEQRSEALHRLAHVFAEKPGDVPQRLVEIAVEFCGADSAGISLAETKATGEHVFRWVAIAGSFAEYIGGMTPRFFSPCGTCLDSGRAQLYRVTKPYYDFLGVSAEPITDGMLIPWVGEQVRGTIWAVSHHSYEAFDVEDYKLLCNLADFALIAIRHQYQEKKLLRQAKYNASAARANELAHQINNPLQSLTNALYLAGLNGPDTQVYVHQATAELKSLSEMVAKLLNLKDSEV